MRRKMTETSPEDKPFVIPKKDNVYKIDESKTAAELEKCLVYQHSKSLYRGIMYSTDITRAVADTVQIAASAVGDLVLQTEYGKAADGLVAGTISTGRKFMTCSGDHAKKGADEKGKDGQCNGLDGSFLLEMFHTWFRYFPPLLLLRWTVDLWLIGTEIVLAVMKDLVRIGPNTVALNTPDAIEVNVLKRPPVSVLNAGRREAGEDHGDEGIDIPELRHRQPVRSSIYETWWSVFLYFLMLGYFFTKMIAIYLWIPMLSIQFYVLDNISTTLNHLAGLDTLDESKYEVDRQLIGNPDIPLKLSRRIWLTDTALDRLVLYVGELPCGIHLLFILGVNRPIVIARRMQKIIRSQLYSLCYGHLAPYLHMDYSHNEQDDPDYVPSDSSSEGDSQDSDADEMLQEGAENDEEGAAGTDDENAGEEEPVADSNGHVPEASLRNQTGDTDKEVNQDEEPTSPAFSTDTRHSLETEDSFTSVTSHESTIAAEESDALGHAPRNILETMNSAERIDPISLDTAARGELADEGSGAEFTVDFDANGDEIRIHVPISHVNFVTSPERREQAPICRDHLPDRVNTFGRSVSTISEGDEPAEKDGLPLFGFTGKTSGFIDLGEPGMSSTPILDGVASPSPKSARDLILNRNIESSAAETQETAPDTPKIQRKPASEPKSDEECEPESDSLPQKGATYSPSTSVSSLSSYDADRSKRLSDNEIQDALSPVRKVFSGVHPTNSSITSRRRRLSEICSNVDTGETDSPNSTGVVSNL